VVVIITPKGSKYAAFREKVYATILVYSNCDTFLKLEVKKLWKFLEDMPFSKTSGLLLKKGIHFTYVAGLQQNSNSNTRIDI
jgi:hypothetical protein